MVAPQSDSEQVRYDILIEAKSALESLRTLLRLTKDNDDKMMQFTAQVIESAKAWGVSWQHALGVYRQLNAELSRSKKATLFGQTGGQDIFGNAEKYMQSLEDAGRLTTNVGNAAEQMGNKAQTATTKFAAGLHFVRIALGALEAMLLFAIVNAVQTAFKKAIDQAKQFEETLYRIRNVEKQLSNIGIDVSIKQLKDGISEIQAMLPVFSKEDVSQMIGSLATTTKELGFTGDQILKLGAAISILNINSTETETLLQTQAKVTNSIISPQAKSIGNLGLAFGKANIEAKAHEMGILQVGQAYNDLTEHQKSVIKYQIVLDTAGIGNIQTLEELRDKIQETGGDFRALNEYLNSNAARLEKNKAAWNDLLTTIGQLLLPFIPAVTRFFEILGNGFNFVKAAAVVVMSVLETFMTTFRLVMNGSIKSLDDLKNKFNEVADASRKMFAKMFFPEGVPKGAPQWFKDLFTVDLQDIETPTGVGTGFSSEEADAAEKKAEMIADVEEKIQDIMQESADKKADIERDYGQKLEDIARDYSDKLADIARETAQKKEDALRDYEQKVEDINRDANQAAEDAQREYREREISREKEYQNRLRELRDKFLMDLEDALHERDARQVLRLIRQYNLDKKNLAERHKLERQQARRDLQAKLEDIERERQLKLEAARREYEEKLQEIAIGEQRALEEAGIWHQRALNDASIWHQRQLQEQREYLQRKLRDLAEAIAREYELTAAGANAIYQLLSGYYGSGGAISQLLGNALTSTLNDIVSSAGTSTSGGTTNSGYAGSGMYGTYAEGGTLIATRPRQITVGEQGAEKVEITPLSRSGRDVGKVFGDRASMGGGEVKIALELSPDLEARIMDSTLDNFSVTLERIGREK